MHTLKFLLYILVVNFVSFGAIQAQNLTDSLSTSTDTLVIDTTLAQFSSSFDTTEIELDDGDLQDIINYSAKDSIVYDIASKKVYLFGVSKMDYGDVQVESELITLDWNTYTLLSEGVEDSTGKLYGTPIFTDNGKTYEAQKMEYNFKTKQGKTYNVITEQDGAYIHSAVVKKNEYDEWYGNRTWYTTCENKDHPHFYIEARKSKVIPGKVMVTGPANLVVSGVNTPLVLPFAIIPTKQGRRSGIIMPEYGATASLGYFFRQGGYHWAVNEKLSLDFTADIYTRGTFSLGTAANYTKRYKFNGLFNFQYTRTPPLDKAVSSDGKRNDISINWRHNKDPKSKPNTNFSASVTGRSSSFNDNTLITTEQLLEVEVNSNVSYTRRFSGKPYSFSLAGSHRQNFQDNTITINAPELIFNVTRFNPFKSKIQTQKKKFYETIGITYSTRAKTYVNAIDSLLFKQETLEEIQYGIQHKASIDAPFNILKHFSINPSFNHNERWYFKQEDRIWDPDTVTIANTVISSTGEDSIVGFEDIITNVQSSFENGFYTVRDFNFNTNISTTVSGIYNFKTKKVKAIRHVFKPTLSYTWRPDFSDERWGNTDFYIDESTAELQEVEYNRYAFLNGLYGLAPTGKQNLVTFSATNNFEMKVLQKNDTSSTLKKIPLIDQVRFSSGYNFSADSLKIQPITVGVNSSFLNNLFTWNLNTVFSAYSVDSTNNLINTTNFKANKRLLRLRSLGFNLSLNLNPKDKSSAQFIDTNVGTLDERIYIANNPRLFYSFTVPWSLRLNYNLNLINGNAQNTDSLVISTNTISINGHVNITPKWRIQVQSGYDIVKKDATFTTISAVRNLHCWELGFDWTAYPLNRQTYAIRLNVVSPVLQALKLARKQPPDIVNDF